MTPNASTNGATKQSNKSKRSQAAPSRVAIPLPMSKPRASKQQSRSTIDPAVDAPAKKELAAQIVKDDHVATPSLQDEAQVRTLATNGLPGNASDEGMKGIKATSADAVRESSTAAPQLNGVVPERPQGGPVQSLSPPPAAVRRWTNPTETLKHPYRTASCFRSFGGTAYTALFDLASTVKPHISTFPPFTTK
jgi:hypothetical protein